ITNWHVHILKFQIALMSCFHMSDAQTTEISPLSLHDALPILRHHQRGRGPVGGPERAGPHHHGPPPAAGGAPRRTGHRQSSPGRSEEHTSELQSREKIVCSLLLEKKKYNTRERNKRVRK